MHNLLDGRAQSRIGRARHPVDGVRRRRGAPKADREVPDCGARGHRFRHPSRWPRSCGRSWTSCARWRATPARRCADLAAILSRPGADNDAARADQPPGAACATRRWRDVEAQRRRSARARSRRRVKALHELHARASPSCGPTRRTRSAGSTTSATPASTTRSAPPRASASTRARSRSPTAQLSPVPPELRDEAFTRRRRRSTSATAARARPSTPTDDGSNPWKPADVDCDPDQLLPGK